MKHNNTTQYIIDLANQHKVSYDKNSRISQLAKKLIELADDDYMLDDIEELVVELMKKDIISNKEGVALIAKYNRELPGGKNV